MRRSLVLPAAIAAIAVTGACESDLGFRPPERPVRVSVAGNPLSVTVRFPPAEDAVRYVLRWTTGADAAVHRVTCDAPPCVIEGLSPDVVHTITVATRDRSGESDPSAPVSARTLRGDEFTLRRGWRYTASTQYVEVVGPGDMDGDGDGELLVGEPLANASDHSGRLLVFPGDRNGPDDDPDIDLPGAPGTLFGDSLTAMGDVNEDGFADVVMGSPGFGTNPGRVLLYRGSLNGFNTLPAWTGSALQPASKTGAAIAAGDVTGDGFPDVVSSAPAWNGESGTFGRVDLFVGPGPSSGTLYPSAVTMTSGDIDGGFGQTIALADVDADGYDDLAVSIPGYDGDEQDQGRVLVHRWDPLAESWDATPDAFDGAGAFALFGIAMSAAGDTDGDGLDELLIGSPSENGFFPTDGAARLFEATPAGLGSAPIWIGTGANIAASFGTAVAGVGDLNDDGYDDLAIGEPGGGATGALRVWFGSATGPSRVATIEGISVGEGFASVVSRGGDVNGDGFPDIALADNAGHVELVYGGRPLSSPVVDAGPLVLGTAGALVRTTASTFLDEIDDLTWTCTWTWGDGASDVHDDCRPGETAAEHTYTAAGEYDVTLRVEASDGRMGEASTKAVIE